MEALSVWVMFGMEDRSKVFAPPLLPLPQKLHG